MVVRSLSGGAQDKTQGMYTISRRSPCWRCGGLGQGNMPGRSSGAGPSSSAGRGPPRRMRRSGTCPRCRCRRSRRAPARWCAPPVLASRPAPAVHVISQFTRIAAQMSFGEHQAAHAMLLLDDCYRANREGTRLSHQPDQEWHCRLRCLRLESWSGKSRSHLLCLQGFYGWIQQGRSILEPMAPVLTQLGSRELWRCFAPLSQACPAQCQRSASALCESLPLLQASELACYHHANVACFCPQIEAFRAVQDGHHWQRIRPWNTGQMTDATGLGR